jgi:hypothetical protein
VSKSTPADLAVAFRSLSRRRDEAIEAAQDAPVGPLLSELDRQVSAAAAMLAAPPTAEAVADAISSRAIGDWDIDTLEALRRIATEAGTVVRRIADAGPDE